MIAVGAAVPIVLFAVFVAQDVVGSRRAEIELRYAGMADAVLAAVDSELAAQVKALQNLAAAPSLMQDDLAAFHEHARHYVATQGTWLLAILTPADGGRHIVNTALPYPANVPALDQASIRRTAESGQPFIGPMSTQSRFVQKVFFPIRVPVVRDGRTVYVLSAAVYPSSIAAIMRRLQIPDTHLLTVFDRAVNIVARSDGDDFVGQPAADNVRSQVQAGDGRLFRNVTLEGDEFLRVLKTSPVSGWHVAVGEREAVYHAELRRTLATLALAGGMAVLASVLLTVVLSRRFGVNYAAAERARLREVEAARHEAVAAQAEAERASTAKSKFLASASHDLRQPLQALRLFLETLKLEQLGGKAASIVDLSDRALHGAEDLLSALLDVARLDAGVTAPDMRTFSTAELFDAIETECGGAAAAKGIALRLRCRDLAVVSDKALLQRIVRNLVVNAIKYTSDGAVLVGCRRRGDEVRIEVWDSGCGIADDQMRFIWEEFYQIGNDERDKSRGLGLGLAIVQKTARLLGHPVDVSSRLGRGSVFAVTVPLAGVTAVRRQLETVE